MQPKSAGFIRILAGAIAANLLGWVVCAAYAWMFQGLASGDGRGAQFLLATAYPNLLLVPTAMGILAAYIWRPLHMPISIHFLGSLGISIIGVSGAYVFMKEGWVCLIIVLPLLLIAVFAGCMIGRALFKKRDTMLISVIPFLLLLVFLEGGMLSEKQGVVCDTIVVRAPPSEVWRHVVAFPRIRTEPAYWLNKVGLPSAAETTCEGEFVGAKRECIFSNGLVFKEVVAELEPGRLLTFDIVDQPNDPELLGHMTLHRGQFELQANGDGTTTLIGRSWYTLHVRPLWYFDWWTRDITREVHLRVMQHIKELSERAR